MHDLGRCYWLAGLRDAWLRHRVHIAFIWQLNRDFQPGDFLYADYSKYDKNIKMMTRHELLETQKKVRNC